MRRASKTNGKPDPEALQAFVEEAGLMYAELGLPPMAGRIIGWLLVCEPSQQTQADLAKSLQASKGSISTMLAVLLRIGIVKRARKPGDRKEYVQLPPGGVVEQTADNMKKTALARELAVKGLQALEGAEPARKARLEEMRDFYEFLEREMPRMLDKFRQEQAAKARKAARGREET